MAHYAVTAIGRDRPGIVAGLTAALRDLGGNLEDFSSTILRGHFAMMLVVDAPDEVSADALRSGLAEAADRLGVQVTVSDVETGTPDRPTATHLLSVYGADQPGIVATFAGILAEHGANVTDLSCRLTGGEQPIYAMVAEVSLPPETDASTLQASIDRAAGEVDVDATFGPLEVETL